MALKQKQGQPVRPTIKPTASKQKRDQLLGNSTNKQAKTNWAAFDFYYIFGFFLRYK